MIEVLNPGVYSSIQDGGRYGYRHYGVPSSGFMDRFSAQYTNLRLGNAPNAPLIEIAQLGLFLRFHEPAQIFLTGAKVQVLINESPYVLKEPIPIKTGDELKIVGNSNGVWSYLGVQGGLKVEKVLGSCSQMNAVSSSSRLRKGDKIEFKRIASTSQNSRLRRSQLNIFKGELRVRQGPDFDLLSPTDAEYLLNNPNSIGMQSNRMAYEFRRSISEHEHSMLTAPVLPGTVQWTPSGRLFCLMRDAQTTGGYPRILQLAEDSINVLSQKKPGDEFQLKLIV